MKTLIELYDTTPIMNILSTVMFRPQEMILICPPEVAEDQNLKCSLRDFFEYKNCPVKLTLIPVSLLDAGKTERVLREVLDSHQDCAIDIAGGTDAALFAAGVASGETPVFTYSTRKNTFFEIKNAPFARGKPCDVHLDIASCLMMAGGTLLPGREDNAGLVDMSDQIDKLFNIYSTFRPHWNRQITYIQKISSSEPGILEAGGMLKEKAGGKNVDANLEFFRALERAELILNLQITDDSISFRFPNEKIRFWLRDIGVVLELQVFRACHAAGCFDDVVLSAVVNWQSGKIQSDSVTNEIDVMAVQGIQPVFISCKTCEVHTEALNELAILRDRFSGKFARAILVTSGMTERTRKPVRRRADKLGIELVEWEDVGLESLIKRLHNQDS